MSPRRRPRLRTLLVAACLGASAATVVRAPRADEPVPPPGDEPSKLRSPVTAEGRLRSALEA